MKRSEINAIMKSGYNFLSKMHFYLPPFARWSPEEQKKKGSECREIAEQQLGWDITDFGGGDLGKLGLFLFTIRNGTLEELKSPFGKTYAEKVMIIREDQITPAHLHFQKMEDIINRGAGELVIQVWNSTKDEKLDKTDVTLSKDGIRITVPSGDTIGLKHGESVCIPQRLYHKYWGRKGKGTVLVGEVSRVNDDRTDNRFYESEGRFPDVEEDELPLYLLCSDYKNYYHY